MGAVAAAGVAAAGSLAAAGIGAMSGGAKGSQTQSAQPTWEQQYGQQLAAQNLQQQLAAGPYTGSFYSPINDIQKGAIDQAKQWTQGLGGSLPGGIAGAANGLVQAGAPAYQNNAMGLFNSPVLANIAQHGGGQLVDPALSGALQEAAISGAKNLQGYQSNFQRAADIGLADNTGRTLSDAAQYVNSSPVNAQIAANNANIERVLNEQTLPGLNRAASMGGSLNSSRAGMAEAMANRDAAQLEAQNAANLQANAFNTGVNASTQQLLGGLNAATAASSAGSLNANNTALGYAGLQQAGNEFNTNAQLNAIGAQLAANQQIGNSVNMGANLALAGSQLANNNFQLGSAAGGLLQQDANAQLQNAYQQWQMQNGGYQADVLAKYMNTVSANPNGQRTATQTAPNSPIANALGAGASAGGIASNLFGQGGALNGLFSSNAAGNPETGLAYNPTDATTWGSGDYSNTYNASAYSPFFTGFDY